MIHDLKQAYLYLALVLFLLCEYLLLILLLNQLKQMQPAALMQNKADWVSCTIDTHSKKYNILNNFHDRVISLSTGISNLPLTWL